MKYIQSEIKRIVNKRLIISGFLLSIVFSLVMSRFDLLNTLTFLLSALSNLFLIYLIILSSRLATEDFEAGTYKIIYTGRYSFVEVLIRKLIVYLLISLSFALIVGILLFLRELLITGSYSDGIFKNTILKSLLIYGSCGLTMFSFAQLLGLIFKNSIFNIIAMFSLFYGLFSEMFSMLLNAERGGLSKVLSGLPFAAVPEMIINLDLNVQNLAVATLSGIISLIFIIMNKEKWIR